MNDSERLRVLMLSNLFPPVVSGSSVQSFSLARELVQRGHSVTMVTARTHRDTPAHEVIEGIEVYRLPSLPIPRNPLTLNFPWITYTFTPANLRRLAMTVARHDPQVLHLHNHMFDLSLSAVLMKFRVGKPLLITLHTVLKHPNWFFDLLLRPVDHLFLKYLVVRHAAGLLCPDVNIVEYAREVFGGRPPHLVPYGIDTLSEASASEIYALRREFGLEGKRVVLSLGHCHDLRDRRDLVKALPMIHQHMPETVLLIVGALSTNTTPTLARELGVEDSVIFAGAQPHSKIGAFLGLADLEAHWLTQDPPEKTSFGIASLEAMAAGKTVLSSANLDTYGRGLMVDGQNMVAVERDAPQKLADKIVGLLGDPERRARIGTAAAGTVRESFSWDSICDKTIKAYREALQEGTPSATARSCPL